ncbi:hypothetical protein CsSME_00018450 [Camellia sinensis var. sinensis]
MDSTYSHHKTSTNHPEKQLQHQQHHDQQLQSASSDLLSSAKLMAEAAKAALNHETVDTGRVAGAAADLLEAVSHYGKLEEKSFGKYVEKAEDYLHQYLSSRCSRRTLFIPDDLQDVFTARLWAASGISDYYGEYSPITAGLQEAGPHSIWWFDLRGNNIIIFSLLSFPPTALPADRHTCTLFHPQRTCFPLTPFFFYSYFFIILHQNKTKTTHTSIRTIIFLHKWRAVLKIGPTEPSPLVIMENANGLALFIVPA